MILGRGAIIFASHRRLFEADIPRYFVGQVLESNEAIIKVRGYSFVRDQGTGRLIRKNDLRTKIVSVLAGTHLLYELPDSVLVESLRLESEEGFLFLSDGHGFRMDLAELPRDGRI